MRLTRGYKLLPKRTKGGRHAAGDYLVVDAVTWSIWKMNEERDATLEAAGKSSVIDRWTHGESEEDECV